MLKVLMIAASVMMIMQSAAQAEWQALAVGQDPTDGAWILGYSGSTVNKIEARRESVRACKEWGGRNCDVKITYNRGCHYLVKGEDADGNENWALGRSVSEAREQCEIDGIDCSVKVIGGCIGN